MTVIEKLLTKYQWLKFSNEQRLLMREVFSIPRSGGVEMVGSTIMSDGSNEEDLKAVNVKSMQEFVITDSLDDFDRLLELTARKIDLMIEDREKEKIRTAANAEREVSNRDNQQLADNVVDIISNLPTDLQVFVVGNFKHLINHIQKDETKTTGTEKNKKGGNNRGAEEAGTGGEEAA